MYSLQVSDCFHDGTCDINCISIDVMDLLLIACLLVNNPIHVIVKTLLHY